jgi:hypothetical protein
MTAIRAFNVTAAAVCFANVINLTPADPLLIISNTLLMGLNLFMGLWER